MVYPALQLHKKRERSKPISSPRWCKMVSVTLSRIAPRMNKRREKGTYSNGLAGGALVPDGGCGGGGRREDGGEEYEGDGSVDCSSRLHLPRSGAACSVVSLPNSSLRFRVMGLFADVTPEILSMFKYVRTLSVVGSFWNSMRAAQFFLLRVFHAREEK